MGTFLLSNWKPMGLLVLIFGVIAYVWILQDRVEDRDAEIKAMTKSVEILKRDLAVAKTAISVLDNGIAQYQNLVLRSMGNLREIQAKITEQNVGFQRQLDNLAVPATAARRISDAPIVPFFLDNAAGRSSSLDGRMRWTEAHPVDRGSCLYADRPH